MIRTRNTRRPTRRRPPPQRRRRTSYSTPKKRPNPRKSGFRFKWRWLILIIGFIILSYHVISLDMKVRKQFEGKRWALPARVYARPLEIYTGMRLTTQALNEELKALGYRRGSTNSPGKYSISNNIVRIRTRAFKFWEATDPSRLVKISFAGNEVQSITELEPVRKVALLRLPPKLIGKIYPTHNEDRILVRLKDIPQALIDALIAMEDRNFYSHMGVSIRGTVRALITNLKGGQIQGGSTITQQLVKNLYLSSERTFKRKFNEAIMALLLEWHYSKDQILQAYFNEVFLGQDGNRAIHGVGMAARFYFNRPLEELKLHQMALLVSLIRGASMYNPRRHPKRALARRNLVLDTMSKLGKISPMEARRAKATRFDIEKSTAESQFPYPAFMGLVRSQLLTDYRKEDLRTTSDGKKKDLDLSEGLRIITTLDPFLQKKGEQAMIKSLKNLSKKRRKARNIEGAMVVTRCDNGEIVAFINGKKPKYDGFNRPLNAVRQIGSLVKVAVFLAALERRSFSLTSRISDHPYRWVDHNTGSVWKPQNYDHRSHGSVYLYRALANSYNLATVRLGRKLGLETFHKTLQRLGLKREFKSIYPSMLLGSLSLTPLEVSQIYQTIASGGFHVPVHAIRDVLTHEGKPVQRYALSMEKRFDPAPIFLLNFAMQQAVRKGTGRKIARTLPANMVFAGKTGTSNDLRDSWFAGFGSEYSTVTWVGRDDNKPMGLSGGSGAMVVWRNFIRSINPQALPPREPSGIKWRTVNGVRIPYIDN
jgi:penicillin-binding protein 1B